MSTACACAEAARFGDIGRSRSVAVQEVVPGDGDVAESIIGDWLRRLMQRADVQVVLQVRADTGQVEGNLKAMVAQVVGRADSGQHQQLRRIDRAAAEDDLGTFRAHVAAAAIVTPTADRIRSRHAAHWRRSAHAGWRGRARCAGSRQRPSSARRCVA